MKSPQHTAPAV